MVSEFDSNNEKSKRRTVDVKSKPTGMRKTGALPKKAENFSESIVAEVTCFTKRPENSEWCFELGMR